MTRFGFRRLMLVALGIAFVSGSVAHGQPVVPAAARQSPLDQPVSWMEEAKRNYTVVKDYSCTLVTQERVKGVLLDKNVIQLKFKEPFALHMKWIAPAKSQGQEVYFVKGKNNNKMRVKNTKLFKNVVDFFSIDPQDPRVLEHSRHTILEAGIGNMIEQTLEQWQKDRIIGKTDVTIQPFMFNGRPCDKIELTRSEKNAAFYCHRTVIYLEKQSKLPVRLENFDWPVKGGAPGGELLEEFNYLNLQFNVGLKDAEFNK